MSGEESMGPLDGPDDVIRDDLGSIVRTCRSDLRKLSGSSLLLTGASGFVGRYLVESVIRFNESSGAAPCVMTLPSRHPDLLRARYRRQVNAGEVVVVGWTAGNLEAAGGPWDYLVHGAATTDPVQVRSDPTGSLRDAFDMAASIVDAATSSDARRVVLVSSGAVYGDQPSDLAEIPETFLGGLDPSTVTAAYGEAKRVSELLLHLSGLDFRVARVFSVVGPYQFLGSSFAVPNMIRQVEERGLIELTSDGSARRSYCYATDLTVVLIKLLLGDVPHQVINVGCREGTASIAEVADTIADIFGGLEVRRGTAAVPRLDYVPSLDRMYEVHAPRVGLREALTRTCHSLHARGLIRRQPVGGSGPPAAGV